MTRNVKTFAAMMKEFADQCGYVFVPDEIGGKNSVQGQMLSWPIQFFQTELPDNKSELVGTITYKDLHAYSLEIGCNHWRCSLMDGSFLKIGYPDIDEKYKMISNDSGKARAILTNSMIRSWLGLQDTLYLRIFPEDSYRKLSKLSVHCWQQSIESVDQISHAHAMMREIMRQLCLVGVATDLPPRN